jgi:hypothetical protein
VEVPRAVNTEPVVEAPLVKVTGQQVLVDGSSAGAPSELGMGALEDLLRRKRELWRSFHPHKPFPGVVTLAIDRRIPAGIVKQVLASALAAGYPQQHFLVVKLPG